jgi:FkbM family methyltransferase
MIFRDPRGTPSLTGKPIRVLGRFLKLVQRLGLTNAIKLALYSRLTKRLVPVYLTRSERPFFVRGRTTDDTVVESVFADNQYPLVDGFCPKTIIDAGANCGAASAYFKAHYPDADIVALEPEQSNFDLLARNLGRVDGIDLLKGALWSRECALQITNPDSADYAFRVSDVTGGSDVSEESVRAYSVEQIMAMKRWQTVDLLKLDIEGSEREIFQRNCLDWLGKVSMIFVELHEVEAAGCGQALFRALAPLNYRVSVCGENLIIRIDRQVCVTV